jgi:uncharacterized membrane protein YphA (DoxX/SURF4 family)
MKYLVTLCRFLVGVLFIISGLIKSNDTVGFAYKLEEYYQVFGTEFLISTAVYQAMAICIVEVALGVLLLLGIRKRLTLIFLMGMIVFFTFLTFYSAFYNKVTDCGCFGDALHLTPWQSFGKDIALLLLISILVLGHKHINALFSSQTSNRIFLVLMFANIAFPVYTLNFLPVIDFRPFAIGKDILAQMNDGRQPKIETRFVFKNLQTNTIEELKEYPYTDKINWELDTLKWKFIDTKQIALDAGELPSIHDFSISSVEGADSTQAFLTQNKLHFFLVSYRLDKANLKIQPEINAFASACEKAGIPFIGLTSNSPEEIEEFRHEVQAPYPYYITDATQLKTMIRSNPGLILLKGSKVLDMWHYNSLPSFGEFSKGMN